MWGKIKALFVPRTINGIDLILTKVKDEEISIVLHLSKTDGSVETRNVKVKEGDTLSLK